METPGTAPEPPPRARTAFAFALAVLALVFFYYTYHVALLALLGVLLAILFDAMAGLGMRLRLRRSVAVIGSATLFVIGCAGLITLLGAPILAESSALAEALPEKTERLHKELDEARSKYPVLGSMIPGGKKDDEQGASTKETVKSAASLASKTLEGFVALVSIVFLGIFLSLHPDRYVRGAARLLPGAPLEEREELLRRMGGALRSYLLAVAVQMVVMGVLWAFGLWLCGIDYYIVFGALAGVVEVVPYVGPMLGLVPPLFFAAGDSAGKVVAVIALYAVLHVIEGYILVPLIMQKREKLPPPITLVAILAFGAAFGFLGVVLAVPLATILYVWAKHSVLGEREGEEEEEAGEEKPAPQGAVTVERPPFRPGLLGGL